MAVPFKVSRLSCKSESNYFETSIIRTRRLQRQDKVVYKIRFAFDKQQDLLRDGENISDSTAQFTTVYMICLIFPSPSQ